MKITNATIEVALFSSEDVIATSLGLGPLSGLTGLFYIPSGQYGDGSLPGNYVEFGGTLGKYKGGAYNITNIYGAKGNVDEDKAILDSVQNGMVDTGMGFSIPASVFENIAKQTYDAFSYGDGKYYTNGISYYTAHWQ